MNEKIKEYKIDNIVMGILSAVVGVILVIFPGNHTQDDRLSCKCSIIPYGNCLNYNLYEKKNRR